MRTGRCLCSAAVSGLGCAAAGGSGGVGGWLLWDGGNIASKLAVVKWCRL